MQFVLTACRGRNPRGYYAAVGKPKPGKVKRLREPAAPVRGLERGSASARLAGSLTNVPRVGGSRFHIHPDPELRAALKPVRRGSGSQQVQVRVPPRGLRRLASARGPAGHVAVRAVARRRRERPGTETGPGGAPPSVPDALTARRWLRLRRPFLLPRREGAVREVKGSAEQWRGVSLATGARERPAFRVQRGWQYLGPRMSGLGFKRNKTRGRLGGSGRQASDS